MSQHIEITRIFDASRELVYRAFTDPGQLAQWFGPDGCSVPRDSIEIDARVGGHLRFRGGSDGCGPGLVASRPACPASGGRAGVCGPDAPLITRYARAG